MDPSIVTALISHGPIGLVAVIACWVAFRKDQDLSAERAARLADAQKYAALALQIQERGLQTADTMVRALGSRASRTDE